MIAPSAAPLVDKLTELLWFQVLYFLSRRCMVRLCSTVFQSIVLECVMTAETSPTPAIPAADEKVVFPTTAPYALLIGGILGIVIVLPERAFPKARPYIPSTTGFGLAFTTPANNTISMYPDTAEKTIVPVSSGFIAGESLIGVLLAALVVAGVL
jgi:hypothetical protein